MGAYVLNEGVRQFTVDESTRSEATGEGFFIDELSAVVDLQLDSTGRIYVLTTDALYRVDPDIL